MKQSTSKKLYIWAFLLYLWLLVWVITLKFNSKVVIADSHAYATWTLQQRLGKNLIPFYTLTIWSGWSGLKEPVMNVLIYLPFGYYIRHYTKSIGKSIAITFASSVAFELIQLFTGLGFLDSTDIVMNTLGGLIGLLLYGLRIRPKVENGFNIVSLCVYAPVAVYALVNTILCWHLCKGLLY